MNFESKEDNQCNNDMHSMMIFQYDVIIFDLDGTLINSMVGITESIQYALKKMGIIEDNLEKLCHFIGPPLREELKKTYNLKNDEVKRCIDYYRERYMSVGVYEMEIYDEVETVLKKLKEKGKIIAVATSKVQSVLDKLMPLTYF